MGSALIQGAVKAKIIKASGIAVFDVEPKALAALKRKVKVRMAKTAVEAVHGIQYVFLCVKPQQMSSLLAEMAPRVTEKQCLISIAAGTRTQKIEAAFEPKNIPVVRVMPNTPALLGFGASAVCGGKFAKTAHIQFAKRFFSAVGKAVVLSEEHFDAVTAVSGSGPAYLFLLAEAFEKACEALGLPREEAKILFKQTILGSAQMVQGSESAAELRRKVTSPGGTTEAAVKHLESQNWLQIFVDAVCKAKERSEELGE